MRYGDTSCSILCSLLLCPGNSWWPYTYDEWRYSLSSLLCVVSWLQLRALCSWRKMFPVLCCPFLDPDNSWRPWAHEKWRSSMICSQLLCSISLWHVRSPCSLGLDVVPVISCTVLCPCDNWLVLMRNGVLPVIRFFVCVPLTTEALYSEGMEVFPISCSVVCFGESWGPRAHEKLGAPCPVVSYSAVSLWQLKSLCLSGMKMLPVLSCSVLCPFDS